MRIVPIFANRHADRTLIGLASGVMSIDLEQYRREFEKQYVRGKYELQFMTFLKNKGVIVHEIGRAFDLGDYWVTKPERAIHEIE